jgi:actin-related protein 8
LEGSRVSRSNAKARPEPIPEHNDPFRIDYTLVEDKNYFVGQEVGSDGEGHADAIPRH